MACESLTKQTYSVKSDVWSFAVLLYELFSNGKVPYEHLSPVDVAIRVVKDGERLEQPAKAPPELYALMQRAWLVDCDARPTVEEFETVLRQLAKQKADDSDASDD